MDRITHVRSMAHYNRWMNERLYVAAATLDHDALHADRGAFFGSLFGTLNHIVVADTVWLKRFATHPACLTALAPLRDEPMPAALDAPRCPDLPALTDGMIAFDQGAARHSDPVVAAAVLAFGFVYIHPFEDGNGRLHRYLIHHVLAERGFNPPGVTFPVSAAILQRIDDYRSVLESYSTRLLPLIAWEPTEKFNIRVLNETGDFYRYFDATPHAEFLYACVQQTIDEDLPAETAFLKNYDAFRARVEALIEMPERTIDLLFRFLQQNDGTLSRRARANEFAALTDAEQEEIETAYQEIFRSDR